MFSSANLKRFGFYLLSREPFTLNKLFSIHFLNLYVGSTVQVGIYVGSTVQLGIYVLPAACWNHMKS